MPVATTFVAVAVTAVVSTAYAMYATREQRREDRRFEEIMKTRINDIAAQ